MLRKACLIRNKCFVYLFFVLCILHVCSNGQLAHAAKDPKAIFDEGVKFANEKNFKKAEKNFKRVIKASPDNYSSYFNLSLIYFRKENYDQSLKYWLETSSLNPFDARTKKLLASTYSLLDKYEESRKLLSELSTQDPKDIDTHKKLGIAHLQESNIRAALSEFTLTRNLSPSDLNGNLLLATSYALNNELSKALEKIKSQRKNLKDDTSLAFYAFLLEKNNQQQDAETIYSKIKISDKDSIIPNLIAAVEKNVIMAEAAQFTYIDIFENLEISTRMADKIKKESIPGARSSSRKSKKKRPFNFKATLTEKWEHYNRRPRTSSPINGLNVTSTVKLEGKNKAGVSFKGEWEGYYNRWDFHKLDFYKINANKRNDFEVDIGKFSAKHFPTLVSFPTIIEGFRFWKKTTLRKFEETALPVIEGGEPSSPINLGELYRKNYVDTRSIAIETTFVVGRTQKDKDIGDRKPKNENTFESSGQFQQWTQAYRIKAKFNKFIEIGSSFAITQDFAIKTLVSESTVPIESIALSMDGGIDLFDGDLTIDAEFAYGNYDEDRFDMRNQHLRDKAWIVKSKYKMFDTISLNYEQKAIGRTFKVEGASQTRDKTSHTIDFVYKPLESKVWLPQSFTIKFKPEIVSPDSTGETKQRFTTVQPVLDIKLPNNSKFVFDSKYYREFDKCGCTNYTTFTFKNSLEYNIPGIQTIIKPTYTFERKNDMIAAPTDEKKKEYVIKVENKSIKNLKINYSFERERKKFNGVTTKSYRQYINSVETKYTFIPSRLDAKVKVSKDYKNPSDTNKTIITILTLEGNYTSKDGDDKFNLKYERKNNKYLPRSDSSAYHQQYLNLKYTRKF